MKEKHFAGVVLRNPNILTVGTNIVRIGPNIIPSEEAILRVEEWGKIHW